MPSATAIGIPSPLGPAVLTPQPVVSFSDEFFNPTVSAENTGSTVLSICSDADPSSPAGPLPSGLCKCGDMSCLAGRTVDELEQVANRCGLSGNITSPFVLGLATYTDLQVQVARQDIRFFVQQLLDGFTTSINSTSLRFGVQPGSLFSLRITQDPADHSGCDRCPTGFYIVDTPIVSTVVAFDRFDNVIYQCSGSARCAGVPTANIIAQLILSNRDASQSSLSGTSSSPAVAGVASFTDIRVLTGQADYSIIFSESGGVTVQSMMFNVVNGEPAAIRPSQSQVWAADLEVFPTAPRIEVIDKLGNIVRSDCYSSCGGAANQCTLNTSVAACSLAVSVDLIGSSASLIGTKSVQTVNGLADFTNLRVDSNPGGSECIKATLTLGFTLGLNGATTQMVLNLEYRPQSFQFLTQPAGQSVANEVLIRAVQLRMLDCNGGVVVNASATVSASFRDNPTNAELLGTTSVGLTKGVAQFLDLMISLHSGDQFYTLQFTYQGNAPIGALTSNDFQIVRPISKILILAAPENTTTVAGRPFLLQPVVSVLDETDTVISLSAAPITASLYQDPGANQVHLPGNARLLGQTVVKAVAGTARFLDLAIDKASLHQELSSTGYQLKISYKEAFTVSRSFFIEPDVWSGLFVATAQQPEKSTAGVPLTVQPWVYLVDQYFNRVNPATIPAGTRVSPLLIGGPPGSVIARSYTCSQSGNCGDTSNPANGQSLVKFTDLQVDVASATYVLQFSSSTFSVRTVAFEVITNGPHEITVTDLAFQNRADRVLSPQPTVAIRDVFGNVVNTGLSFSPAIRARLIPKDGKPPTQPPAPPSPGQADRTVARVWPTNLEGSQVNTTIGGVLTFTDLAVRQVMTSYVIEFSCDVGGGKVLKVNSTSFEVTPGDAVGISSVTYPAGCNSLSPCLMPGEMRCVDLYGNIQDSCKICREIQCVDSFAITAAAAALCPAGSLCVKLAEPVPLGAKLYSNALGSQDCSLTPCASPLREGSLPIPAMFTDLTMNVPSTNYRLEFFVFTIDPVAMGVIYEWKHISPFFNNSPPAPTISSAQFSLTMSQLTISFDRKTNMNQGVNAAGDTSCFPELDPTFVAKLGQGPYCTWTSPYAFLVSLGKGAQVDSSTKIELSATSSILHSGIYDGVFMTSLPATTTLGVIVNGQSIGATVIAPPPALPTPKPTIVAASNLGACDRVKADASLSLGDASRAFKDIRWGVDVQKSSASNGILKSGSPARFIKRRIHFSSNLPGDVNTVTVTLRPSAPIIPFAIITITGLPEYNHRTFECPASSSQPAPSEKCYCGATANAAQSTCTEASLQGNCRFLNVSGPDAHIFASRPGTSYPAIQWVAGTNKAILVVASRKFVPSDKDSVITFNIINPWLPMPAPSPISISSSCIGGPLGPGKCYICDERSCLESAAKRYNFLAVPMEMQCGRICQTDASFQVPNANVSLVSGSIGESSKTNGAQNTLTVTLQPSYVLPQGSRVIIGGLYKLNQTQSVCVGGPDAGIFRCNFCAGTSVETAAAFDRYSGDVTLTVRNGSQIPSDRPIVFTLGWVNPPVISRETCLERDPRKCSSIFKARASFVFSPQAARPGLSFPLSGDALGAGFVPSFDPIVSRVFEHNTIPGANNVIGFHLLPNLPLRAGTVIRLKGLVGFKGTDPGSTTAVTLVTEHGMAWDIFTSPDGSTVGKGKWEASTSSLLLKVAAGRSIQAGNVTRISIVATNPLSSQSPQTVEISASFAGCDACANTCGCDNQPVAPLAVAAVKMSGTVLSASGTSTFIDATAKESTAVPGQVNLVTISTYASSVLLPGTTLTVAGLFGAQATTDPEARSVALSVGGVEHGESGPGVFSRTNGTFIVTLPAGLVVGSGLQLTVGLPMRNGRTAVNVTMLNLSATATIEVRVGGALSDIVQIQPVSVSGSVLSNSQPAKFQVNTVTELTRVAGAFSVLTFKMRPNFAINGAVGDTLTISGLVGAQWPPTTTTIKVVDFPSILPNCSCIAYEGSECTCTEALKFEARNLLRVWCPDQAPGASAGAALFKAGALSSGENAFDPATGTARLPFATSASVDIGQEIIFSIGVRNPSTEAALPPAPTVTIATFGGATVTNQALVGSVLSGSEAGSFTRVSMTEVSSVARDFNRYTVELVTNFPIVSVADQANQLLISGLLNYQTPSGYIPIEGPGNEEYRIAKAAAGNWSKSSGVLNLQGGVFLGGCTRATAAVPGDCAIPDQGVHDYTHLSTVTFSFTLKNALAVNAGSNFPSFEYQSSEVSVPRTLIGGGIAGVGKTTASPAFTRHQVSQSTNVNGVPNVISLNISLNVVAHQGSVISVTGLVSSRTPSGSLTLSGPSSPRFATTSEWNKDTGVFMFYVGPGEGIPANDDIQVSFTVENPETPLETPTVASIGASLISPSLGSFVSGSPSILPQVENLGLAIQVAATPLEPVQVPNVPATSIFNGAVSPEFIVRSIWESTRVNFAINTIVVTLVSNVALPASSQITISDLNADVAIALDIPLEGAADIVGTVASWVSEPPLGNYLRVTLQRYVEPMTSFVFRFKLQNGGCATNLGCQGTTPSVSATGPLNLLIASTLMSAPIFGAGAPLSWILKTVSQTTTVSDSMNTVTFELQPNARLYAGSVINIYGLTGTTTESCPICTNVGSIIAGLGCSKVCETCPIFRVSEGVTRRFCLPVFNTTMQPHPKAAWRSGVPGLPDIPPSKFEDGVLTITVADGYDISELEPTTFIIIIRNAPYPGIASQECTTQTPVAPTGTAAFEPPCLAATVQGAVLCLDGAPFSNQGCNGEKYQQITQGLLFGLPIYRSIWPNTPAVDHYGVKLPDSCSTCMRHGDIWSLNKAFQTVKDLVIDDLYVYPPSRAGMPTLIDGGLAPGFYSVFLELTNWLGVTGRGTFDFTQATGFSGPMGDELVRPLVAIAGVKQRTITSSQPLQLYAAASAATCSPRALVDTSLRFLWSMTCTNCPGQKPLSDLALSLQTFGLLVPASSLMAGGSYVFTVEASQASLILDKSYASVVVNVRVLPPIGKITGVSDNGVAGTLTSLTLSAATSFDPEKDATKIVDAASGFTFSWDCYETLPPPPCPLPPVPCPEVAYAPCTNPQPLVTGTTGVTAVFDGTRAKQNWNYMVKVNVTRNTDVLPSTIDRSLFAASGEGKVSFATVAGRPVTVTLTLCEPVDLGRDTLCQNQLKNNRVGASDPIVLRATGVPTTTLSTIAGYQWSASGDAGSIPLTAGMVRTSVTSRLLIIEPGFIQPAKSVRFRVTVRDTDGEVGYAETELFAGVPPMGGTLAVTPQRGTALDTKFTLTAEGWVADGDAYPLTYEFFAGDPSNLVLKGTLSSGTQRIVVKKLQPGSPLLVGVTVQDATGAVTTRTVNITVESPAMRVHEIVDLVTNTVTTGIQAALFSGDVTEAGSLLVSSAAMINSESGACNSSASLESATPVCTSATDVCCKRRALRALMVQALKDITRSQEPSPQALASQASILRLIVDKPAELDLDLVRGVGTIISDSISSAKSMLDRNMIIDIGDLAKRYAGVLSNVMDAHATITKEVLKVSRRRSRPVMSVWERGNHALRQAVSLAQRESDGWWGGLGGGQRRARITPVLAWESKIALLKTYSQISSFSVVRSVVGQRPSVITMPTFTINTSRVDISSFIASGFEMNMEGTFSKVKLPKNLLDYLSGAPYTTWPVQQLELAHTLFTYAGNPFPGAVGPMVTIEVRQAGSSVPVSLGQLGSVKPSQVEMVLKVEGNRSTFVDSTTGARFGVYGEYFDETNFKWSPAGITVDTEFQDGTLLVYSRHLSHFAAVEVAAGCDSVPLSGKSLDSCGVCGGDNSTCSGCDGIPNTGRNTLCSGHGSCRNPYSDRCRCEANYYGPDCENLCRVNVECSNNGMCNFVDGRSCICNKGFGSLAGVVYPGPFCTEKVAIGIGDTSTSNDVGLPQNTVTFILTIVLPSVIGCLVCSGLMYFIINYRKRQLKFIRKTVIEFPQPQLLIPAESRPDPMVMNPDATGWTNFDLPEPTAQFSYGPNSGQLATAIAASQRAAINHMSIERIERRTKVMKDTIISKTNKKKYVKGPSLGHADENEGHEFSSSDESGDSSDDAERAQVVGKPRNNVVTWQMSSAPEWLNNITQPLSNALPDPPQANGEGPASGSPQSNGAPKSNGGPQVDV